MRAVKGFSLVELMIVIAIVAIFMTLAAPSFQEVLNGMRVRSTAEAFNQGLQLARSEAIKRNDRVEFNIASTTGWAVCPSASTAACATAAIIQSKPALESSQNVAVAAMTCPGLTGSTPTKVTFTGLGRQYVDGAGAYNNPDGTAEFCGVGVSAPATQKAYNVLIQPIGFIKMCDPSLAAGTAGAC